MVGSVRSILGLTAALLLATPGSAQRHELPPPHREVPSARERPSLRESPAVGERRVTEEPTRRGELPSHEWRSRSRELRETREREWGGMKAHERRALSERIGEEKMMKAAERLGYEKVLTPGRASERPQGFDAVFRDRRTGELIVAEAKGGYNGKGLQDILGNGYGHRQGTIGWAREAAAAILKPESTANARERETAREVLRAIEEGKLRVEVFHTEHRQGTPGQTTVYRTAVQRR